MGAWAIHTARFSTQQRDCLLWGSSDAHSRVMASGHDQHLHAKAARQSVICSRPSLLAKKPCIQQPSGIQRASKSIMWTRVQQLIYLSVYKYMLFSHGGTVYICIYTYIQIDTYTHIYIYTPSLHTAVSVSFCGCTSTYTGRFAKPFAKLLLSPTI